MDTQHLLDKGSPGRSRESLWVLGSLRRLDTLRPRAPRHRFLPSAARHLCSQSLTFLLPLFPHPPSFQPTGFLKPSAAESRRGIYWRVGRLPSGRGDSSKDSRTDHHHWDVEHWPARLTGTGGGPRTMSCLGVSGGVVRSAFCYLLCGLLLLSNSTKGCLRL